MGSTWYIWCTLQWFSEHWAVLQILYNCKCGMVGKNYNQTPDMITYTRLYCLYSWPLFFLQGDNSLAMQILQHEWHKIKEVDRSKASIPAFQVLRNWYSWCQSEWTMYSPCILFMYWVTTYNLNLIQISFTLRIYDELRPLAITIICQQ